MKMTRWMVSGVAVGVAFLVTACVDSELFHGAIAVSDSTGNVAIVSKALSQSEANEEARDTCDAKDCSVILQFDKCGAFSSGRSSAGVWVYAAAAGGTAFDAQTAANSACTANGGVACAVAPNLAAQCN